MTGALSLTTLALGTLALVLFVQLLVGGFFIGLAIWPRIPKVRAALSRTLRRSGRFRRRETSARDQ